MTFKIKVFKECIRQLDHKINELKLALSDLTEGAENDSKSSAGDKHETSRAMMQLEQEKINQQLNDALVQKVVLDQIDPEVNSSVVETGSLVKTDKGYLFISAALGKVRVDDTDVITISIKSPLAQKLTGLKKGQAAEMNGTKYMLESVL